ncbi:hypothetical protein ANO11243_004470 [Dothideomycetidae sp. 11243]|nr:hypothetical protein ANO11243_004470 [fungal sp. No.11243]
MLPSTGTSISTNEAGCIFATTSIPHGGNVLISNPDPSIATQLLLGNNETELTDSALTSTSAMVTATANASGKAYLLDLTSTTVTTSLPSRSALRSTDWLTPTTAVLGSRNGAITLWDTRARGAAHRFTHPVIADRIISAPDGTGVWVGGTGIVRKYDTRMTRDPKPIPASTHPGYQWTRASEPVTRLQHTMLAMEMQLAVSKAAPVVFVASSDACSIFAFDERSGAWLDKVAGPGLLADSRDACEPLGFRVGRIRMGADENGREGMWYALGDTVHRYVF